MTRADLENFEAVVAEPLSVRIQAGTLYNAPPPTQGLASLIILALFDRLRVTKPRASSTSTAWSRRPSALSGCATASSPIPTGSAPSSIDSCRRRFSMRKWSKIDVNKAAPWPAVEGEGDTIWMGAADRGLVVSYIQSIYWEFGSGCVLPATGVLMQNRGASFSLDPKALKAAGARPAAVPHPQSRARRAQRRPRHGLWHHGRRRPAADAGPVFSRHVMFGQPLEKALDGPRWLLGRTWGSSRTNLRLEARFDGNIIDRLLSAKHDVEVLPEGYSDTMGHAGAVIVHPAGVMEGGHDPRADGGAAGI